MSNPNRLSADGDPGLRTAADDGKSQRLARFLLGGNTRVLRGKSLEEFAQTPEFAVLAIRQAVETAQGAEE